MLIEFKIKIIFSTKNDFVHEMQTYITLACSKAKTKGSKNMPFLSKPTQRASSCTSQAPSIKGTPPGTCPHVEEAPVSSGQKGRDGSPGDRKDEKQQVSGFYIQWQSQSLLVGFFFFVVKELKSLQGQEPQEWNQACGRTVQTRQCEQLPADQLESVFLVRQDLRVPSGHQEDEGGGGLRWGNVINRKWTWDWVSGGRGGEV
jgi:hypothetical protein